ncbi:MAG: hypothetical protein ACOYKZ_03985 [Chlamydiia bacterium]
MARSRSYQDWLIEELKDCDKAAAYLRAAWEESLKGDRKSQQLLQVAIKNVAEAQNDR